MIKLEVDDELDGNKAVQQFGNEENNDIGGDSIGDKYSKTTTHFIIGRLYYV